MNLDINFIVFAAVVLSFVTGIYCLVLTKNMLRILIGLEILTKAVTLMVTFAGFVTGHKSLSQSFVITLIIIEVVVMVVACGIVIGAYRHNETLNTDKMRNLKG
jgi:NADH-quinone oxidoreductase subunit K